MARAATRSGAGNTRQTTAAGVAGLAAAYACSWLLGCGAHSGHVYAWCASDAPYKHSLLASACCKVVKG